jgi:hypothetical protein
MKTKASLALLALLAEHASASDFFETRIRPLLAKHCYSCHTASQMGGLRVDSRERLLQGGKSGQAAVVAGDAEASLLIHAVERRTARLSMPPQTKLSATEIADLRQWITAGALFPATNPAKAEGRAFWSFQPVRATTPPQPQNAAWPRTDIDRFLLARLESEGLAPAPAADRATLLRRVTFDLIGLPPTPEETAAFLADRSRGAYANVIDRLLASPHYGERWARHWLDLARYSDGSQGARDDTPYPNAFRYRDWVVSAFNRDLPYDLFLKAQIAADQLPGPLRAEHLPALGFQTIGESDHDRLDVTTRAMLGLTVGCAQCHDHKFDPIPTRDYYSLLGVFKSSKVGEHPLVAPEVVNAYKEAKRRSEDKQAEIKAFTDRQTAQVVDILASQTADYLVSVWKKETPAELDAPTLDRWKAFLANPKKEHPYFDPWFKLMARGDATEAEVRKVAADLQEAVHAILAERKALDDRNHVKLGGIEGKKDEGKVISTLVDAMPVEKFYFWRDLASPPFKSEDIRFAGGIYYYDAKSVVRFFDPRWKRYSDQLRAEGDALKKAIPELYPFWHVLRDTDKPKNIPVALRGNEQTPGEEAPRRFLSVLCDGEPAVFQQGSGRLELAEAIASAKNPLTARVMVNRIWKHHFGEGLVRSTSNFGQLGDRPTHPELLDYLAARFVASGWSMKAMHREMLLSAAYQMVSDENAAARDKDPDNRLLSHANLRERLDAEALRDSILAVAGTLDRKLGGPGAALEAATRRTLYATVSRSQPDRTLAAFDFPDPNASAESRMVTVGPMQRLFFMNSAFVAGQSKALAERVAKLGATDAERIARTYELLYNRPATEEEIRLGAEFVNGQPAAWPQYAQVLLSAAEFSAVK